MISHGASGMRGNKRRASCRDQRRRAAARRVARAITIALASAIVFGAPRPAAANGRYPLANQLVVDPVDDTHLLARTTFGVLRSDDAGASWSWICEDALGALETAEDPALAITGDGATLVAFSQGLTVSRDGCSWIAAAGLPAGRFAVDVTVSPRRPHAALAIELLVGAGTYSVQLVASADDGASWAEVGVALPGFLGTTVEVAPSTADRVYVSGKSLTTQQNVLARSDDGGHSLLAAPFVLADVSPAAGIFIGAVDPIDPDTVYLRVSPTSDAGARVLVSHDGGATFGTLLTVPGDLSGFALSPDGATLAVGSADSGLYVGSAAGGPFPLTGTVKPTCLAWVGSRLLACASEAVDRFTIGISDDGGAHFASLLRLADVTPGRCPRSSSAGVCTAQWSAVAAVIGADAGRTASDADAGPDAGADAQRGTASHASGCACGLAAPARRDDGCGLTRGGSSLASAVLAAVLVTVLVTVTRCRRRRRAATGRQVLRAPCTGSPCR